MAFLLSLEGIKRRDSHPPTEVFSALGQPVLVHGARPARHQVHSSGPWDDPSREWSRDAGEFTRAPVASVLVVPHVLIDSQCLNPCEAGGVIRCGLQARLDMGPHGFPRGS